MKTTTPAKLLSAVERSFDANAVRVGLPFAVLSNETEEVLARFGDFASADHWAAQWPASTSIFDARKAL